MRDFISLKMECSDYLQCDYCDKKIKTKYDLDKHINAVHNVNKNTSKYCSVCGNLKTLGDYYKTKYGTDRNVCKDGYKKKNNDQEKCPECRTYITKRYLTYEKQTQVLTVS